MRYLTEHEYALASRFLFLSMAITVIQKDITSIETGNGVKIKEPYLELLKMMEDRALTERQQLRKYMYEEKVSVEPLEKNDTFTAYLFISKQKEEKRHYFNPAIRKKVEQILTELMMIGYEDTYQRQKEKEMGYGG
ncbi:hypothetical protein SAMN05421734_10912 [Pelagirhabdus alkalitolerans]|uniref:Uncharacterized protein n=1 Tax=Pelagirhabdus alkalitolerans TaxID=1612202 RepID=A0A1G6LMM1_9BACI|nr:hypothetical protein [Pelagirhabdus alkalitolerans]SDC44542.1 hypothetical protein SAMN05421734_10912 [Pelagirhabdus alkalitolerans]